jgi:hypothetical protein
MWLPTNGESKNLNFSLLLSFAYMSLDILTHFTTHSSYLLITDPRAEARSLSPYPFAHPNK